MRTAPSKFLRSSACLIGAAALALSGCSKQTPPSDVLAKVGAREFRVGDLKQEAERRIAARRPVPSKEILLQEMVEQEALVQRAKAAGIDNDPQVAREISNLLVAKLLDGELAAQVAKLTVTAEEISAAYQRNVAAYTKPAKARLAILFAEVDAKSSDTKRAEVRGRLQEALKKFTPNVNSKTDLAPGFGSLSVDYSDDQVSRYRGGDAGWFDANQTGYRLPKLVIDAGFALKTNQPSEILETSSGFYVVMKTDAREGFVTPLDHVQDSIRRDLLAQKRRDLEVSFRSNAMQVAGTTINTQRLAAVELPQPDRRFAKKQPTNPPALPVANEGGN